MGAWADKVGARDDLRRFLSDGPQDRPVKRKPVVGPVDGLNTTFYAFDDRLLDGTLTVSYDEVDQVGTVLSDAMNGLFTVTAAPAAFTTVRARYYFQYFLDTELDEAVELAAGEIVESDDVTQVVPGLKLSTLWFATHMAWTKLGARWTSRESARLMLEEAPLQQENMERAKWFSDKAREGLENARKLRLDYYQNHGRRVSPAFAIHYPNIPRYGPRR